MVFEARKRNILYLSVFMIFDPIRVVAAALMSEILNDESYSVRIFRTPMTRKTIGFDPKYCVAPMVGQSDLAFRLLCLTHGATVCWTEMLFSEKIITDPDYCRNSLKSCSQDRPLIVQLCGNDPKIMAQAANIVEQHCQRNYGLDGIDINLGCPQKRAQDGHYGSFLLDKRDWSLVESIVRAMDASVSVPVTCKIRLLQTEQQTLQFCGRLQAAGAAMISVHGRQRGGQRHGRRGPANLEAIAAVKRSLSIPVISNGNIRCPEVALPSAKFKS